jgi:phage terminase small subunit
MVKTQPVLVTTGNNRPDFRVPPRPLGEFGRNLWDRVQAEYRIEDTGGMEILCQACQALDLAESLAETVRQEGQTIETRFTKRVHPAIREELQARAFVVRALKELGLNVEAVKPSGRPPRPFGWMPDAR